MKKSTRKGQSPKLQVVNKNWTALQEQPLLMANEPGVARRIHLLMAPLLAVFIHRSPHTLRHTFSTLVSELGVPLHIVEKILNHSLGGMLAVYNHQEFLGHRKQALRMWADRLTNLMKANSEDEVDLLVSSWNGKGEMPPAPGHAFQRTDSATGAMERPFA